VTAKVGKLVGLESPTYALSYNCGCNFPTAGTHSKAAAMGDQPRFGFAFRAAFLRKVNNRKT
jgi:hypothetical protein